MLKELREHIATISSIALLFAICTAFLVYMGTFAKAAEVRVVENKADFVMDVQIDNLHADIVRLEIKRHKTASERQHLDYLRKKLANMKKVRNVK